jgi:excisionase family DNA binding protein
MKLRIIDDVEVHSSSGNAYADLGFADAEQLKIKTDLVIAIRKTIKLSKNLSSFVESAKSDYFYRVEKIKLDFAIELDRFRRDLKTTAAEFAKELGVDFSYEQVFGHLSRQPLSAAEAAEYLGISLLTLRRYVQAEKLLPSHIVGRKQMFSVNDLRAYKRNRD